MIFLVTLLMPMMGVLTHEIRQGSRVIAGEDANYKDYPYYGLLVYKIEIDYGAPKFFCGTSLISDHFFLTAGHCTGEYQTPDVYGILMGVDNACEAHGYEIMLDVDSIFHPPGHSFDIDKLLVLDIALVRTKVKVVGYNKILLPRNPISTGQVGTVIGFGVTVDPELPGGPHFPCTLKQTPQKIVANSQCHLVSDKSFCARGIKSNDSSTCSADSGSPWISQNVDPNGVTYEITGIVSGSHKNCHTREYPNILTDVHGHLDWINGIVATELL